MENSVINPMDDPLYRSAWEASESMRKHRVLLERVAKNMEKPDSDTPVSTLQTLTSRRNATRVRLISDGKSALAKLKLLGAGESFTVPAGLINNIRVACSYQKSTYGKEFRTEKFKFNRVEYLKVLREK